MVNNLKKRIGTIIVAVVLFISCFSSYAYAAPSEWQGVWAAGSRATATWDAYQDADYYYVEVFVNSDDGNTFIGSIETGTDALRIDLQ